MSIASTAAARKKGRMSVADFISHQIEVSGKKQKDIAEELGYEKANVITMIKQGRSPLPLNKIGPLAKALNVDPFHLLRLTMMEYNPHTWEAIEGLIGRQTVSKSEMEILEVIREVSKGHDIRPASDEERIELMGLAEKWRQREEQRGITEYRKKEGEN